MKDKVIKYSFFSAVSFIALTAFSTISAIKNPEQAQEMMEIYRQQISGALGKEGIALLFAIFRNNLFACAICIGLGLVPFICIPVFILGSNAISVGVVIGASHTSMQYPILKTIVFGLLPHGIFELTAVFLSVGMGISLFVFITLKILGKRKDERLIDWLNYVAKIFVLRVIPLLIIAALIESFITPILMALFM